MNNIQELGKFGEKLAEEYLLKNNYTVIDKNFKCSYGEIDIIAHNQKQLVFIEVKTRTNKKYGRGIASINKIKEKHIYKTAQYFLYGKCIKNPDIRIDAIEVNIIKNKIYLNHYLDIIKEAP